jgi:hypothetical protein
MIKINSDLLPVSINKKKMVHQMRLELLFKQYSDPVKIQGYSLESAKRDRKAH